MALRYEAWSLPWVDPANFKRKVASVPVLPGTGRGSVHLFSTGGQGEAEVPLAEFKRMNEIVSGTQGSLMRVFDGSTLIHEWEVARGPKTLENRSTAPLSGPSIASYFDKVIIYPREYPTPVSPVQDHIWAGDNILDNPGMEEAETQVEKYEVWRDATGGTFTLTVMGQTTGALPFDITASALETNLQALSNVDDVTVDVGDQGNRGSEDNPWVIEFHFPPVIDPDMTGDDTNLTGGTGTLTIKPTQQGRDDVPKAWTKSEYSDARANPKLHGRYSRDGFRRDDTNVHSGDYAIRINGLTRYAGIQQIVQVEPGLKYQASIWVFTSDATERFKFVMRASFDDGDASGFAQISGNAVASTWTQFAFEFTVPTNVDTLVFRFAATGNDNPVPFWVDDAELIEGEAATTPGDIMQVLLDDAAVDHVADARGPILDWVDYSSFDAVNDSNNDPWVIDEMSFTAQLGQSYGQVLDEMVNRGVEWDLVAKATPSGGKTHDLHLYNKGGRDDNPATAINVRQGISNATVIDRHPDYTAVLVEGSEILYEDESAAATNFGRKEKFIAARDTADLATLTLLGDEAFLAEAANRRAITANVIETLDHPRPGVHYRPGDRLWMQFPGLMPEREERRVVMYDYTNTKPTTYQVTGSRTFEGEAAAFELVRRLWRRYKRPEIPRRRGSLGGGAAGGVPTVMVAAVDSRERIINSADVQATGNGDESAIQAAIDEVQEVGGGRVVLAEGTFSLSGGFTVPSGVELYGMGQGTILEFVGPTGTTIITAVGGNHFAMFTLLFSSANEIGIAVNGDAVTIDQVTFSDFGGLSATAVQVAGDQCSVTNCLAEVGTFVSATARFRDVTVANNRVTTGQVLMDDSESWNVSDNVFGDGNIIGEDGLNTIIAHNIINSAIPHASDIIFGFTGAAENCIIDGNSVQDAGGGGIKIGAGSVSTIIRGNQISISNLGIEAFGSNCLIIGNLLWFSGEHGIKATDCLDGHIAQNIIHGPGQNAGNTYDGIILTGNSDRNSIDGNHIRVAGFGGPARYGINISAATCNDNAVGENFYFFAADFGTAEFNDAGTGTQLPGSGSTDPTVVSQLIAFGRGGTLAVESGSHRFVFPIAATIVGVTASVGVAPTGASVIVDVHKNGTTIFTTQANRPEIAASGFLSAHETPDVTAVSAGQYITVDIDQIGSTLTGEDLTVIVEWRVA